MPQRGATAASQKVPGLLGSESDDEEGAEDRISVLSMLSVLSVLSVFSVPPSVVDHFAFI